MSTPVLPYSSLPPNSRITATTTPEGLTISIPPASLLRPILACAFVCLLLTPMTIGVVVALTDFEKNFSGHSIYFAIGISLTILIFWCAVGAILWQILRRRKIPTILNLTASQLTIVTPELPKLRHDFRLDQPLLIKPLRLGLALNLRATGTLHITQNHLSLKILPGRDLREINWIAHTLNNAIAARSDSR